MPFVLNVEIQFFKTKVLHRKCFENKKSIGLSLGLGLVFDLKNGLFASLNK